jgi:hypothetical protein
MPREHFTFGHCRLHALYRSIHPSINYSGQNKADASDEFMHVSIWIDLVRRRASSEVKEIKKHAANQVINA